VDTPPATAENSVGQSFPPRCRWLRLDLCATALFVAELFDVYAARGWCGRSRQRSGSCGLRCCVPKGPGQISPGQSVAPPRVAVAIGSQALEGRHRRMHRLSRPFRAFLPQRITLPRATATLAQLASPCPGLICRAPSGQMRCERRERAAPRAEPSRHGDGWLGSDSRMRNAKKMLATAAAAR